MGESLDADGYDSPATKEISKFMRLSPDQIQSIRYAATATFGQGTAVWLFGSRVDDTKKGGDIDLLVRPTPAEADQPFVKKIRMLTLLERLQVATQAAGQLLKVVERFNQKLLEI